MSIIFMRNKLSFIFFNFKRIKCSVITLILFLIPSEYFLFTQPSINLESRIPDNTAQHFSPNLDGIKDKINLSIQITEENLASWLLLIYSREKNNYKLIRRYESVDEKQIQKMTFKKYVSRIWKRRSPVLIPQYITWDGYSKIPNSTKESYTGKKMPDGLYYYRLIATDDFGNTTKTPLIPIVIDTIRPAAQLTLSDDIFSPNNDGRKETLIFNFSLEKIDPLDKLYFNIKNNKQNIVFQKNIRNLKANYQWIWDGKDVQGNELPSGYYSISYTIEDLAGNKEEYDITQPVKLVKEIQTVNLISYRSSFAPNNTSFFDILSFDINISSLEDIVFWKIAVFNSENRVVYEKSDTTNQNLPKIWTYDGVGKNKKTLPDGDYKSKVIVHYRSGNQIESSNVNFLIDTTPPKLKIAIDNKDNIFLPKSKNNNKLIIKQTITSEKNDLFLAKITDENGQIVFKENYTTSTIPKVFNWDGKRENGITIPGNYVYQIMGYDSLSNTTIITSDKIELIDELAKVKMIITPNVFSPNEDDIKDKVRISFQMKKSDQKRVIRQMVYITLSQGKNNIFNTNNIEQKSVKIFSNQFYKSSFNWNGINDQKVKSPDGIYLVYSFFDLKGGETTSSAPKTIYLDTKPILVDISMSTNIFSPNNDGRLEKIEITQKQTISDFLPNEDKFTIIIKNINEKIIKKLNFDETIPPNFIWRGKDQNNNQAPEGQYIYQVQTMDKSGNQKSYQSAPFVLIRSKEKIDYTLSSDIYSYAINKAITITPKISSTKYFYYYTANLKTPQHKELIIGSNYKPQAMQFKEIIHNKKNLDDGIYSLQIKGFFSNGNEVASIQKDVIIDSIPPKIDIQVHPEHFSPDRDGENEILNIGISTKDPNTIISNKAYIFRYKEFQYENKKYKPFKQKLENYFSNKQPLLKEWDIKNRSTDKIIWNGKNDKGKIVVESANDYIIFVDAIDRAKNRKVKSKLFSTDVFVEKIAKDRYKIIINSIVFKYNSDVMIGHFNRTIGRLVYILNKFKGYKIEVEGHTDMTGSQAYNEKLSLKRARAVYKLLVSKDISPDRMTFTGKGKLKPIYKVEKNEEEARKNRRVEFYLQKE